MIGPGLRAVLVLTFVFGAGVVAGVFFERHHSVDGRSHELAVAEHERSLAELREVVGLDDEQMATVHRILAEHQRVVQLHWEQLRPEVQEAMRQVHREIAGHLRPDQIERYHRWLQEQRERHERLAAESASRHPPAHPTSDQPADEEPQP